MKTHKIIGLPPAMHDHIDDAPYWTEMYNMLVRTCNIALITPGVMGEGMLSEAWKFTPAWNGIGEKDIPGFVGRLADIGVDVTNTWQSEKLAVAFQNLGPLSESYSNNFSQNSLLASLNQGKSEIYRDAAQIWSGANGSIKTLLGDRGNKLDASMNARLNKIEDDQKKANAQGAYQMFKEYLGKPEQNIDFPMMWRGSTYSADYNIMIRLINHFPADDVCYNNNIVAPLMTLMQFICPRSDDGAMFTSPYIMRFHVPGRVMLSAAYCSNMSVVYGGDVNDISYISRPNIVDISMTISPVHSTKLNSMKYPMGSDAPSLEKDVQWGIGGKPLYKDIMVDPDAKVKVPYVLTNMDNITKPVIPTYNIVSELYN